MEVRVFTDGACKSNGKANARASYAAWFPDHPEWSFAHVIPEDDFQTNQRAELLAIYTAVNVVLEKCGDPTQVSLHIYTDSTYCKNCLTSWLPGWLKNDWKNTEGKLVKHRDLIEETSVNLPRFKQYIISYVRAHTGKDDELSRGNAKVDQMAVDALRLLDGPPPETVKAVSTTAGPFADLPLVMMGPPLEEKVLVEWCKTHMDQLDPAALKSALFTAFQKTIHKNGYQIAKQRVSKTTLIRLVASSNLVTEGITIIKQDE
jgi:ribonuclease HI